MSGLSSPVLERVLIEKNLEEGREPKRTTPFSHEGRNWWAALALWVLALVLAYTAFEWGGVVRTGRYQYLLVLGSLAMLLSLARSQKLWFCSNGLRLSVVLLPTYVLLQVVPLPVAMLRLLSPVRAEAIDALGPIGARMSFASLSVFPAGTFQYFLLVCGYIVIFLSIGALMWRREDSRWVAIWPVLVVGSLEAGLGLWQYFGGPEERIRFGTYANYNHYAGFLEMALPFAVMYPIAVLSRTRSRWQSSVAPVVAACGIWALAALIFAGIAFSLSKMGFIAALSSLLLMAALVFGNAHMSWVMGSRRRRWVAVGMVAALVLGSFVLLPPDRLIQRFAEFVSTDGLTGEGRTHLWMETIPLIRAYPAFGCGLGGYETAFSRFKISGVLVTDDFAHNDYLQLLAELGLVGFAIGATLALSVVRVGLRGAVKYSDPQARYFAIACVGALFAIGLHSLADFNLYVPANAMLLAWIAGMTVAAESWEASRTARRQLGNPYVTAEKNSSNVLDPVSSWRHPDLHVDT